MVSIANRHRREGRQEGRLEGRQEGLLEGCRETVKGITEHLLQKGYSGDEILSMIPECYVREVGGLFVNEGEASRQRVMNSSSDAV